jgi:hypothetical protein
MSTHSRKSHSPHEFELPEGPDEMVGLTEGGKTIIGILLAAATLGLLVWLAVTLAVS